MGYPLAMKPMRWFPLSAVVLLCVAVPRLRADLVEMQNGDRYAGKVLAMSADTVVLESEMLGKINVPRKKVTSLTLGTNAAALKAPAAVSVATNLPAAAPAAALGNSNLNLSAALRQLGANTNFVGQIRQQMLAGSPEAAGKYDEMVTALMTGKMNLNDLRSQAKSYADQLRALKRDLGPEAGDSVDTYLEVLDNFIKETADVPAGATPRPQSPAP
jgi:hypothetical protein